MKKAIALLLALALVGGAVFAQDAAPALKFSGALYAGLVYEMAGEDDAVLTWNRNKAVEGYDTNFRTRINGSYTNGDAGAYVRFQSTNFGNYAPTQAYGWAKFLDGMIKVNVGKLGDYTFATTDNSIGNFDGKTGVELIVMPMDGLSIGALVPTTDDTKVLFSESTKALALGAAYTIADVATIKAGYAMGALATATAAAAADGSAAATVKGITTEDSGSFYFGVDVSAIENVTALLEGKMANLGSTVFNSTYLYESFGYTMDALYVGLWAEQTTAATDAAAGSDKMMMTFAPNLEYALEALTVGAEVSYTMANENLDKASALGAHVYGKLPISNSALQFGLRYASISGDAYTTTDIDAGKNIRLYTAWQFNF